MDCMNLNMANAEEDCSLNAPPRMELILVDVKISKCILHVYLATCVLKQESENPSIKAVKIARYKLEVM